MKLLTFSLLFLFVSCQKDFSTSSIPTRKLTEAEELGRKAYLTNCILCHNPNPKIDGTIGPALFGSSLELLEARVLTRGYPEGYKPKRDTEIMPEFPNLKDDIEEIKAYIDSFK